VWFWKATARVEKGPQCIRDLRQLVQHLPEEELEEMLWKEVYTKQEPRQCKLLKHLLRFGDKDAPDTR
jgi:hypothetical protein